MDVEQLMKLSELKEKGILTPEEFEKQKAALLNNTANNRVATQKNGGIDWGNFGKSFLYTIIYCVVIGILVVSLGTSMEENVIRAISMILTAVIMSILAFYVRSGKYQGYDSCFAIFIITIFFGPLAVWRTFYMYLQIKQGKAILKGAEK